MCNLPFLADRNRGIDTPASAASRWVLSLPANARILVFCQASDRTAITIRGKVEYTVYPRRFESAWDRLPSDAADRYDAIILLGRSGAAPPNWRTEAHTDRALLELPATAAPLRFAAAPARARRLPAWLGDRKSVV